MLLEGTLVSPEELQRLVLSLALPHLDGPGGFSLGKDLHEIRDALRRPLPQPAIEHDQPQAVVVDRLLALDHRAFWVEGWTRDEDRTFTTLTVISPDGQEVELENAFRLQKARRRGPARRGRAAATGTALPPCSSFRHRAGWSTAGSSSGQIRRGGASRPRLRHPTTTPSRPRSCCWSGSRRTSRTGRSCAATTCARPSRGFRTATAARSRSRAWSTTARPIHPRRCPSS